MGLFSNNTSDFKSKYNDTLTLISQFSFGTLRMSDELASMKIRVQFMELLEIAKRFNNLDNEHFSIYISSAFGEKISIAEGIMIIQGSLELAFRHERISKSVYENVILYARNLTKNSLSQAKAKEIINGYKL